MKHIFSLLLPAACILLVGIPAFGGNGVTVDKTVSTMNSTDDSLIRDFFQPAVDLRYTYDDGMDLKHSSGQLSMHEAEITVPIPLVTSPNFYLMSDLYYRYYQMDVNTAEFSGRFDLHSARVPIQAAWLSADSPWFVYALVAPGISSEFKNSNEDSLDMSVSLDVGYRFSPRFVLAVGAYYTRDYGDDLVLPSIGILWAPTDKYSLSLTSAGIIGTYKCNDDWRIKLKGIPYGGRWFIDNNGNKQKIELSGGKVGVDIEHRIYKQAWLRLGAGANVFSNLRVEDARGREVLDRDLKPALYVTGALHWAF